jgi:hypothetical protein
MNDVFWVGAYPGLDDDQIAYIARSIAEIGASARGVERAVSVS